MMASLQADLLELGPGHLVKTQRTKDTVQTVLLSQIVLLFTDRATIIDRATIYF